MSAVETVMGNTVVIEESRFGNFHTGTGEGDEAVEPSHEQQVPVCCLVELRKKTAR